MKRHLLLSYLLIALGFIGCYPIAKGDPGFTVTKVYTPYPLTDAEFVATWEMASREKIPDFDLLLFTKAKKNKLNEIEQRAYARKIRSDADAMTMAGEVSVTADGQKTAPMHHFLSVFHKELKEYDFVSKTLPVDFGYPEFALNGNSFEGPEFTYQIENLGPDFKFKLSEEQASTFINDTLFRSGTFGAIVFATNAKKTKKKNGQFEYKLLVKARAVQLRGFPNGAGVYKSHGIFWLDGSMPEWGKNLAW